MKQRIRYRIGKRHFSREINYIPMRYIFAMTLTVLEILAIIGIVGLLCYYVPLFYAAAWLTEIGCVIHIASSDENPDYKVPWLLVVMLLPIAGFMLYFLFYSRKLKRKYIRRMSSLWKSRRILDDGDARRAFFEDYPELMGDAEMLCKLSDSHFYKGTRLTYYPSGEAMLPDLLTDLRSARSHILIEYFLIEEGELWGSILEILRQKAREGVKVCVLYDDIGCMATLAGNYARRLARDGIDAAPFSRLRGNADSEFNNRNHRKITVIDGKIGYTGGVNLADEYINRVPRFGHWKDSAIRLEGEAVFELTSLFLLDFGITKRAPDLPTEALFPPQEDFDFPGFTVPFGDGPRPIYPRGVGKLALCNLLRGAQRYVFLTSPYLVLDSELCRMIENTALRGVDVRIVVPHVPDKRFVFEITRSYFPRLLAAGVRIYEYTPGFLHSKLWLSDDRVAVVGTINLDYRSLVHHFENAVWICGSPVISELRADLLDTIGKSEEISAEKLSASPLRRLLRSLLRIFSPLL